VSQPLRDEYAHAHDRPHGDGAHGHSHGLVDRSIIRSREGVKAVSVSLGLLGAVALVQVAIFVLSGSVALLADLIHNFGDGLTAVPLGIAFFLRSFRGEKLAGLAVVLAIFVSACVALYETIQRLIHPQISRICGCWRLQAWLASSATSWPREFGCAQANVCRVRRCLRTGTTLAPTGSSRSEWSRAQSSSASARGSAIRSSAS
jgi:hypothetical protein